MAGAGRLLTSSRRSGLLVQLCTVASLCALVSGSHFRYGTLSWRPLDRGSDDESVVSGMQNVETRFFAAFRRDYSWGKFFEEEYKQTKGNQGSDTTEEEWNSIGKDGCSKDYSTTDYWTDKEAGNKVCYTTNPLYDDPGDSAGSADTGYDPATADENYDDVPGERFYIRLPPFKAQLHTVTLNGVANTDATITVCAGPHFCDFSKPGTDDFVTVEKCEDGTLDCTAPDCYNGTKCYDETWNPSECGLQADEYETYYRGVAKNGNADGADQLCASWDDTYGYYIINPDGTFNSRTVTLTTYDIDYSCQPLNQPGPGDGECNSITGNFINGYEYSEMLFQRNTNTPYLAYFTGGKRIYECQYGGGYTGLDEDGICSSGGLTNLLQNNAEGLYRLEMEIWILGDGNASPVVSQLPTVPVPRSALTTRSLLQIPAYDYDNDDLVFRFGDVNEMGGLTRSKMCQFPYSLNPVNPGQKDTKFNQFGDLRCTNTTRTWMNNKTCPTDRTPRTVWGTTEFSFTSDVPGLVEWNTYYTGTAEPLIFGLYNMVVMVHDLVYESDNATYDLYEDRLPNRRVYDPHRGEYYAYKTKSPLDYLLYLYDGPVGFCNKACKDNKDINIEASLDGLTNNGYDLHKNEEDPGKFPGYPTFADPDGIYGVTNPYWRSVYQNETAAGESDEGVPYGPLNYSDPFSQNYYPRPGYSAPFNFSGMDRSLVRMSQKCTICGYGDTGLDNAKCTPFAADGICGVIGSDPIVPTATACVENEPPTFVPEHMLDNLTANPEVQYWFDAVHHVNTISDAIPYHDNATLIVNIPGEYKIGNVTYYKGVEIEFIVVAYDDDDCVELTLEHAGLPFSPAQYVDGELIPASEADFTDLQILSDYPEFPEGMKMRKSFLWTAPARSEYADKYDTRDERSRVCFYAYDKYLLTNRPFYCLEIFIVTEPVIIEELKECYCRTCSAPRTVGEYTERIPTPNHAPRTEKYMSLLTQE